jgi:Zn-dependent M28 family amino/carboxypeptidase
LILIFILHLGAEVVLGVHIATVALLACCLFGGDQPKDEVRVEWTWWGTDHQSPVGTFADSRLRALLQSTPKFCTIAASL